MSGNYSNVDYNPLYKTGNVIQPGQWVYYNYTQEGSYTLDLTFTKQTTVFFFAVGSGGPGIENCGGVGGKIVTETITGTIFEISIYIHRDNAKQYPSVIHITKDSIKQSDITTPIYQVNTHSPTTTSANGTIGVPLPAIKNQQFEDGNTNKFILISGDGGDGGYGSTKNNGLGTDGDKGSGGGGGAGGSKGIAPNNINVGGKGQNGFDGTSNTTLTGYNYLIAGNGGNGFNFSQGGVGGGGGGGGRKVQPGYQDGKNGTGGLGAVMIYYQSS